MSILPTYSPSNPSPEYTSEPSQDETSLQITPRHRRRRSEDYVKQTRVGKIVLKDQDEGVSIPSYGRASVITGDIHLENQNNISSVFVKVITR